MFMNIHPPTVDGRNCVLDHLAYISSWLPIVLVGYPIIKKSRKSWDNPYHGSKARILRRWSLHLGDLEDFAHLEGFLNQ